MNDVSPLKFTGSIPQHYDDYLGPMFFEPYAEDVQKLITPLKASNALEIACGTGRVTRHLRQALPSGATLVASDLSDEMLSIAREKLKSLNIDWKNVDAQALPFEDNSLDLIVCYFGYMLVPDKEKAYAEAMRTLRKGGMLLMATWDKLEANEASHVFRMTLKQFLGDTIPATYKVPFSMHDAGEITTMLKAAGFSKAEAERVSKMSACESASRAAYGLVRGGALYNEIMKRDPALADQLTAAVEKTLAEKYGAAPMMAPMSALIVRAWK